MTTRTAFVRRIARTSRAAGRFLRDIPVHLQTRPPAGGGALRRIVDQGRWLLRNGITAENYYKYSFFEPQMDARAKEQYMGSFEDYRFFDVLNDASYTALTEDKLLFYDFATRCGIPVPPLIAVVGNGPVPEGVVRLESPDALETYLRDTGIEDFVLKPVDGVKGYGILSLGRRLGPKAEWESLPTGRPMDATSIAEHCRGMRGHRFLVQARLRAHPVLAQLVPGVLSSFRIITIRNDGIQLVAAALRAGRGHVAADNLAQGGIAVPVNIETGVCGEGTELMRLLTRSIRCHPVSHIAFAGLQVPEWEFVKALVHQAAEKFWFCRTLGWDVALTDRGPMIIETNRRYGTDAVQLASRTGIFSTSLADLAHSTGAIAQVGLLKRVERAETT